MSLIAPPQKRNRLTPTPLRIRRLKHTRHIGKRNALYQQGIGRSARTAL
nr:MAG TPA: hypothetical protein [Caudoviricetes sp.]